MLKWIVLAIVAAAVIYVAAVFNRLVRLRNLVREGWSGIDVQLKRRTDLVPSLVETVKGYATHERNLFEELTRQRAGSITADTVRGQAQAEKALQGSIGKLMAVAEAYPELKANQNFLDLQKQLAEVEDQLQMARRYYNGAVRNLNISIESFPGVLIARTLGFKEEPFFELDDRSATGGLIAKDAIDDENLRKATEEARKTLAASGHYEVVDTAPVAGELASAGGVQRCNGCETALGEKLGAERSMIGLFARVSRTEYTLQIVVRDTRTGAILSNAFSGLRMGANYAWPRAVASLIDDKIPQ